MRKLDSALQERMAAVVATLQCEWVGCELHAMGRQHLLRIYVDRPGGVTVDDCSRVSRQISALLDVEDPIHDRYVLEVSSPGIDRPLFTLSQYQAVLGQRIKVTLHTPQMDRRHYTGLLLEATSEYVRVSLDSGESATLLWAAISKAHVIGESR